MQNAAPSHFSSDQRASYARKRLAATALITVLAAVATGTVFLLPGGVSPQASAWLPRERDTLGAGVARAAGAILAELGRTPDPLPGVGRLPRDHGALLLELAALALERDPSRGARFAEESLAPWLGACGRALAEDSRSPLYRALGALLAALHPRPLPLCPEAS